MAKWLRSPYLHTPGIENPLSWAAQAVPHLSSGMSFMGAGFVPEATHHASPLALSASPFQPVLGDWETDQALELSNPPSLLSSLQWDLSPFLDLSLPICGREDWIIFCILAL